jgi:peptidoglycan/LPS O-acetylase OafA/YrhL
MADAKRIVELDGLRAVAALMVFGSHAFHSQLLWSGVDLFFVLSGFLITGVLLDLRRRHAWRGYIAFFYARRSRRILPPYLLFLAVTSVLFGVGWARRWYLYLFLMNAPTFLSSAPYAHGILWSLAVEEQFYLIWPIIVYVLDEAVLAWLSAGLIIAAPLLRWITTAFVPHHWPIYTGTPFRMDLLAAGALIALAWRHHRAVVVRLGHYAFWFAAAVAISLCLLSLHPWFQPGADTVLVNVWLYEMIVLGYASALLWALSGRWVGFLRTAPMVYLGQISYSVYLIQLAAIAVMRRFIGHNKMAALAALAVTLCYAAVSWKWNRATDTATQQDQCNTRSWLYISRSRRSKSRSAASTQRRIGVSSIQPETTGNKSIKIGDSGPSPAPEVTNWLSLYGFEHCAAPLHAYLR